MDDRSTIEIAWAAGFFDGEGTITAHRGGTLGLSGKTTYLMVAVKQAAAAAEPGIPDTLARFVAAVGIGHVGGPYVDRPSRRGYSSERRPVFMWYARGANALEALDRLWPQLGAVKRAQAEAAIALFTERRSVA